jgi:hypothetical protein
MNKKFTYVVPFYFGERMVTKRVPRYNDKLVQNKFYFVEKHIDFLNSYPNNDIEKVIFLVNQRPEDNVDEIKYFFASRVNIIKQKYKFVLTFRENKNISYGAWNDAICNDLQSESDESSYYFCLEDDYIPSTNTFAYPFIERCNEATSYVCCLARFDGSIVSSYASVSNGLFLKSSCKRVYENNGSVFALTNRNEYTYSDACNIQEIFYRLFLDMGYNITDISDLYYVPFFESDCAMIKKIGNVNGPSLIEPILI